MITNSTLTAHDWIAEDTAGIPGTDLKGGVDCCAASTISFHYVAAERQDALGRALYGCRTGQVVGI
jgi:hypothetical protein